MEKWRRRADSGFTCDAAQHARAHTRSAAERLSLSAEFITTLFWLSSHGFTLTTSTTLKRFWTFVTKGICVSTPLWYCTRVLSLLMLCTSVHKYIVSSLCQFSMSTSFYILLSEPYIVYTTRTSRKFSFLIFAQMKAQVYGKPSCQAILQKIVVFL